ncbi:hypothetical protein NUU61_006017 [Penicillium alfredii]|uniref:Uncharacterized protein n=1 Tax=Penicillium alfredii TaxID=1506179 RepID=A0A9W9F033_9EURO|nr:uncharacterized protein NUU61_006017 [Penicillium alfredii]KAJ5091147.1 hypothetical protein NUU61_006017 [Penicillium alfredii]
MSKWKELELSTPLDVNLWMCEENWCSINWPNDIIQCQVVEWNLTIFLPWSSGDDFRLSSCDKRGRPGFDSPRESHLFYLFYKFSFWTNASSFFLSLHHLRTSRLHQHLTGS